MPEAHLEVRVFHANWHPGSQQVKTVFEDLSEDHADNPQISIIFSDADQEEGRMRELNIETLPGVVFNLSGEVQVCQTSNVSQLVQTFEGKLEKLNTPSLEDRLKALINMASLVLFMKGSKDKPYCGFSSQMIQILNEHHLEYSTFDILLDETVRQGLKEYSDWPTFPQLYSKGELIGGLDIIKDMVAEGTLLDEL